MAPRSPALAPLALLALLACSRAPAGGAPATAREEEVPAAPASTGATVRRVESRDEVPLRGPRVDARPGDWLLRGDGGVAVVSAAKGTVVDLGAEGGDDALVSLESTVFVGLDQPTSVVESVEPAGEHAVLVKRRMLAEPAVRLWTYVTFVDGALRLESVATAGEEPVPAVTLGEVVAWGNVPTWVEGHGFATEKASFAGDFIAREGLGVAYALAPESGHLVARFAAGEPGFHESARTGERVEVLPARGSSERRIVTVAQGLGAMGAAVESLPRYQREPPEIWPVPATAPPRTFAEVRGCDGAPFARFDVASGALSLPHGAACALRLAAPGHAPGAWVRHDGTLPPLPEAGTLRWAVREGGAVVPARLVVRGLDGTPDPDWGEGPWDATSLDVIHADRDGERPLPPGRYRVSVTRGFEYTMHEQDVRIVAGQTATIAARLERVVDTAGWLAADLHVHAIPSSDAPTPLADRVVTLAAAGVEVAVATDHNVISDYGPTIRQRGLGAWLASIQGDELTTRGVLLGHYNVFPLSPGAPLPFEHTTPAAVLSAARTAPPETQPRVVQVNHPRMGAIGYFELLRFDPRDVGGWRARSSLAETGFDAIEVFNGDHYAVLGEVERAMRDWYALLDAGVRITATGNSDSHKVSYHECGVPRNLVRVGGAGDDDPARFDEGGFVEAVRAGHVVVSSGPFVQLEVAGHGVGDTAPAGEQEVHVTVDAPPWVDVSRVELVKRGETVKAWTGPFGTGTRRLDARFTMPLAKGEWVIAVARGEKEMRFLARPGAKPFGFTNPVWIE